MLSNTIRVLIVDDHAVVRDGLKYAFAQARDIEAAGEAGSANEALMKLRRQRFDVDVVLLDLGLPDRSGLALLHDVRQEAPRLPILILSTFPENQYALQVIKDGANGYLSKGADSETLVRAIRVVASGRNYLDEEGCQALCTELARTGRGVLSAELSPREREILLLIVAGKALTSIGEMLHLSVKTVSTYRTRILEKTGLRSNADLTRYALQRGLTI